MSKKVQVIILAAGEGKRMGADVPKVLVKLDEKPMLLRLLEAVEQSGVDPQPIVVIASGERGELVKKACNGYAVTFVEQAEQLGTGHAVQVCEETAQDAEHILVLYGDHPLLSASSITKVVEQHTVDNSALTLMTTTVQDFQDWRSAFSNFGRIVRQAGEGITQIVEYRDANPMQLEIREVNPGYMCFRANWLWQHLKNLKADNSQAELYLTDVVEMAANGGGISSVSIEPVEALGINSKEQLAEVQKLVNKE